MNCTGEAALAWGGVCESRTRLRLHFHKGVVSASSSVLPRNRREELRNRRRGKVITLVSTLSFRWRNLWKRARENSYAFLHRDDLINRYILQSIDLAARPSDLQQIDL